MSELFIICFFAGFSFVIASINLSLHRPTSQTSIFRNKYGNLSSERAVDGNYDLIPGELSCAVTEAKDRRVFWQVTLAETSIISHIHFVFEKTSNITAILQNHEVYVTATSKVPFGNPCYKETRKNPGLINEVYCMEYTTGRFVTYFSDHLYNGVVALLLICEVEVYGCPVGYYGTGCDLQCSRNCASGMCEPDYGHCLGACNPGFRGDNCDLVCSTGFYGNGCALTCSHTCLQNSCVNTNGTCFQCLDGFQGDMCNISTRTTTFETTQTTTVSIVFDGLLVRDEIGERRMYIIALVAMATALALFIIMAIYCQVRYRKLAGSKTLISQKNGSINQGKGEDNQNYQNSKAQISTISKNSSNTLIYDSPVTYADQQHYYDSKSSRTLPYANQTFEPDPGLSYEPLERDGIYPRESKHIYDPLGS